MILKASQRAGGLALANHLLSEIDNDHVTLHKLRGFIADDLRGAMKEAHAISRGTRCKQFLFSLSLNPPERETVPVEVFESALDEVEAELDLAKMPRAVVFHEKEGRRHAHGVWSRIDPARMKAVNLSFFKSKLRNVSRKLYLEHGWEMPRGLMNKDERNPFNFTLEEWQQAKKSKVDPRVIRQDLRECWVRSDSAGSFERSLASKGYSLARGDKRGYVVVDWRGEVYSLSRWAGQKTTDIRARLGDPARWRSIESARSKLNGRLGDRLQKLLKSEIEALAVVEREFADRRRELVLRQRKERTDLRADQNRQWLESTTARNARLSNGLAKLWLRVTGKFVRLRLLLATEAQFESQEMNRVRHRLVEQQIRERQTLRQEKQLVVERRKLEIDLLRADSIAGPSVGSTQAERKPDRSTRGRRR